MSAQFSMADVSESEDEEKVCVLKKMCNSPDSQYASYIVNQLAGLLHVVIRLYAA